MIVLNSFRCFATTTPSAIFKLNNFFIRCFLLLADGFSYMLEKVVIRPTVVVSFTTLCTNNLDKVNLITPSTCLSRRAYSASSIYQVSSPEEVGVISSDRDNLQSASSNTQSLYHQTSQFFPSSPVIAPTELKL